jgi:hypothetical protein
VGQDFLIKPLLKLLNKLQLPLVYSFVLRHEQKRVYTRFFIIYPGHLRVEYHLLTKGAMVGLTRVGLDINERKTFLALKDADLLSFLGL